MQTLHPQPVAHKCAAKVQSDCPDGLSVKILPSPFGEATCVFVCVFCVAADRAVARASGGFVTAGAGLPPQYSISVPAGQPGYYAPCADGFYGLEPGTLAAGGTITEPLSIYIAIHEVSAVLGAAQAAWWAHSP